MHRTKQSRAMATIVVAMLAQGAPMSGRAQDGAAASERIRLEVTGSRIARTDTETALPVQTITRKEIEDAGIQTMQDLLERISANQSYGSWNEAKGIGSLLSGYTGASLRGLGSKRTLILLNGRRLAPYALSGGESVDLSGIPPSGIERVEVLKDGASAVYGTDAIGGVINFILRKDYAGAEANANYYTTEHGGGDSWRASATAGWGDLSKDRFNAFVSADYYKQQSLKATQRDGTKTTYLPSLGFDGTSGNSFPANIGQTNLETGEVYGFAGFRNPTVPFPAGANAASCLPPYSFPTDGQRRYRCGFDTASVVDTIPETEKANVVARATFQLAADQQLFAEGSYYQGKFTQRIAPTPVIAGADFATQIQPTSPFYPTDFVASLPGGDPTKPVEVFYRTLELGPRVDRTTTDQWNAVVGLQGAVKGWDYEVAGNYTRNRQVNELVSGYFLSSQFRPLLASGVINPFGANTPSVLEQMRATQFTGPINDNVASNIGFDLKLSNNVAMLPGGPIAVAFGAEARRENLEASNSDALVSGDIAGGPGEVPSLTSVSRNVWSLFGEVDVPITRALEATAAVRHDRYSDFGGTTNYKVTARWQPIDSLLLRASYGTGFRAPTLGDLHLPQIESYAFLDFLQDPVRCPVTEANSDCNGLFMPIRGGGNPALQPEKSDQFNAGLVFAPAPGLSMGVDYYRVKVRNVIGILPIDTILDNHEQLGGRYIVRKPPDAHYPDLPGPIEYVVQYPTNTGDLTTSGVDVNLEWRGSATSVGQFSFVLNGTYVIDYTYEGFESFSLPPGAGARGPDGAIARYRQYAQLGWTYGAWGATLANNYQSGYSEPDLLTCGDEGCTGTRRVGTWSVWDAQLRYTPAKNATFTLGVRNLFDRSPPVSNQFEDFQSGYDPSYADPRGRTFYGTIQVKFP